MPSSVNKSSSIYTEPYIFENLSESYKPEKSVHISDIVSFNDGLNYCSHIDRLFQKKSVNTIFVNPPPMPPGIENRLFLSDIIRPYHNLISCWESYLKKLENLPQDTFTETITKLCKHMAQLSQISRDVANKKV